MAAPWFRPKSRGYGATPVTWQGWLLTIASGLVTMAGSLGIVLSEMMHLAHRRPFQAFCAIVAVLVCIIVARRRTVGEWDWRS